MKVRLLLILAGFAIGFAFPALAQQTNPPDPKLRETLSTFITKYGEAFNNGDAAALAAFYTVDALEVTDSGPIYGREAIEKHYADLFQKTYFSDYLITLDPDSPHSIGVTGKDMWGTGGWSATIKSESFGPAQIKGYWSVIREGDDWKIRMMTWNVAPAPPPPAETNALPTLAQEQKPVEPQVHQQIDAIRMKLRVAMHKQDAAAAADFYTLNGLKVLDWTVGTLSGRDAIEKDFAAYFASGPSEVVGKSVQMYAVGNEIVDISEWSSGPYDGHSVKIYVRDADTWKIRLEYVNSSGVPR